MKDVLLIADLHGQFGKIDSFLDLSPEAVFIAGDITNMGPVETVDDVLVTHRCAVFCSAR